MGVFEDVIARMVEMDIFRLFFPWLLVLAIVYGVLEKYHIFSEDEQVNGVIALAFSFITVGGTFLFMPEGLLTSLAAGLTFSVFGLLGLMILLAVAGYDLEEGFGEGDLAPGLAIALAILTFLGAFFYHVDVLELIGAETLPPVEAFNEIIMPVLVLIFLIAIVAIVMDDSSGED